MTKSTEIPRGHDNWVITGRDNDGKWHKRTIRQFIEKEKSRWD